MKLLQVALLFMFVMLAANVAASAHHRRIVGGDECKTNGDCPANYFCVSMDGHRKCVTNRR